jgi:trans-aconitate methyltransferase
MARVDDRQKHWTQVYETKPADSVSWFQAEPAPSLAALGRLQLDPSSALIDVGGGASNLVDELLRRGWTDLTVLDIADTALDVARARLGQDARKVHWEVADITAWRPTRAYDVWHDRAVFHFLTDAGQRDAYRRALGAALASGGHLIIATFAPDGPERCSDLPVQRYDASGLAAELGPAFRLINTWREEHVTPGGAKQSFTWCAFERV